MKSLMRLAPQMRTIAQTRNMSAVSGPPSYRMSFQEKLAHGLVMCTAWFAFPTWVLINIKNYRAQGSE